MQLTPEDTSITRMDIVNLREVGTPVEEIRRILLTRTTEAEVNKIMSDINSYI
jgi:hypothetical protein